MAEKGGMTKVQAEAALVAFTDVVMTNVAGEELLYRNPSLRPPLEYEIRTAWPVLGAAVSLRNKGKPPPPRLLKIVGEFDPSLTLRPQR